MTQRAVVLGAGIGGVAAAAGLHSAAYAAGHGTLTPVGAAGTGGEPAVVFRPATAG